MASILKGLFANKLLDDDREAFLTIQIPGMEGEFAIFAPRIEFWRQLVYVSYARAQLPCSFLIFIPLSHVCTIPLIL